MKIRQHQWCLTRVHMPLKMDSGTASHRIVRHLHEIFQPTLGPEIFGYVRTHRIDVGMHVRHIQLDQSALDTGYGVRHSSMSRESSVPYQSAVKRWRMVLIILLRQGESTLPKLMNKNRLAQM